MKAWASKCVTSGQLARLSRKSPEVEGTGTCEKVHPLQATSLRDIIRGIWATQKSRHGSYAFRNFPLYGWWEEACGERRPGVCKATATSLQDDLFGAKPRTHYVHNILDPFSVRALDSLDRGRGGLWASDWEIRGKADKHGTTVRNAITVQLYYAPRFSSNRSLFSPSLVSVRTIVQIGGRRRQPARRTSAQRGGTSLKSRFYRTSNHRLKP